MNPLTSYLIGLSKVNFMLDVGDYCIYKEHTSLGFIYRIGKIIRYEKNVEVEYDQGNERINQFTLDIIFPEPDKIYVGDWDESLITATPYQLITCVFSGQP